MSQMTVGVRELKARLSHYLRQVSDGTVVVITERGRPVGQIVPVARLPEDRLRRLVEDGRVAWDGSSFRPAPPTAESRSGIMVSDILLEDRQ